MRVAINASREIHEALGIRASETAAPLGSLHDVGRLRPFLALGDFKLHLIAFLQALVSLRTNRAVVHKHIGTVVPPNETISFSVVEPLNGSFQAFH